MLSALTFDNALGFWVRFGFCFLVWFFFWFVLGLLVWFFFWWEFVLGLFCCFLVCFGFGVFLSIFFNTSGMDNLMLKERGEKAVIKLIVVFVVARKAS